MQVIVDSRSPEARAWRGLAQHRASLVLRRLRGALAHAHVWLMDVNGPRGGADKLCRVVLQGRSGGELVVTAVATDFPKAVNAALARAAHALRRSRDRLQRAPRSAQARAAGGWRRGEAELAAGGLALSGAAQGD